jgi:hypothetical protein
MSLHCSFKKFSDVSEYKDIVREAEFMLLVHVSTCIPLHIVSGLVCVIVPEHIRVHRFPTGETDHLEHFII